MADIRDGFKDIFLAGVGALAYGGERANELVNNLIEKGSLRSSRAKSSIPSSSIRRMMPLVRCVMKHWLRNFRL